MIMYDTYHKISSLSLDLVKKFKNDCSIFFETGTNTGKGIEVALAAGFERIISIDIEEKFVQACAIKFQTHKNLSVLHGDSGKDILTLLQNIEGKTMFWLDGHAEYSIPLLQELQQIAKLQRHDHVIMIDDVRMFGTPLWNNLSQNEVLVSLYAINAKYNISYHDSPNGVKDILVAS